MKLVSFPVAYMPLVDAAPLIVAQEMGFAAAEGLDLDLIAAPSWSSVRDMLAFGRVDAAHLLSPVPIAAGLGLGGVTTQLSAVSVLSVNGNVIGVNTDLAAAITGGIGLAASGNVNPDRTAPSMFEPVHGSAPDIAGQQKADPTAAILSTALLLDHLGHPEAAATVERAVLADLSERAAAGDTAPRRTSEVGDAIAARVAG